jgi:hypothetical protein
VGRNKEEVAEHILRDRTTINEEDPELSNNLSDFKELESNLLAISSTSIFD